LYLRAGFPIPLSSRKDESVGSERWIIRFRGGETRLNGMEPRIGDLTLALEDARPGFVRWRAISDSSHMPHFLNWQESSVQMGSHRRPSNESHLDSAISTRPRSGVVLRTDGTLCRSVGRWISHRCSRYTLN
jgi:hypothetical protein